MAMGEGAITAKRYPNPDRDARYAEAAFGEFDTTHVPFSLGLSKEQWDALPVEDRLDIEEYFSNATADALRGAVPSEPERAAEVRAEAKQAVAAFMQKVASNVQIGADHYRDALVAVRDPQHLAALRVQFADATANHLLSYGKKEFIKYFPIGLQGQFFPRFIPAISSYLEHITAHPTDATPILEWPAFQEIERICVDYTNEYSSTGGEVIRHHDWVHASEEQRKDGGVIEPPRFAKMDKRKRYANPRGYVLELYPTLFLPLHKEQTNMATALMSPTIRREMAEEVRGHLLMNTLSKYQRRGLEGKLQVLSEPVGPTDKYRQYQYEQFIKWMAVGQAADEIPDITPKEIEAIEDTFDELTNDQRPELYKRFAARVFSGEARTNPRLFLDEILTNIRIPYAEKYGA